ncbi:RNI-like protein [Roridomyces roridus]|uniref:RNI-like protein n=1 Tax=Roridomyces roridus TaxID=1738132 RepID=A0AAD7CE96_9AGAR|nr:RNI-like protein [Roridomyces roridus]
MAQRNGVRGPMSALTEFLRSTGITPTTIARRVATQEQPQPEAGPSRPRGSRRNTAAADDEAEEEQEYASDNLDEPEEETQPQKKKPKLSKAAEAKLKAKAKAAAAMKKKKGEDDEDYEEDGDEDEDAYTALSKSAYGGGSKPPVGSFETCAKCEKQFTVTKYTMAANPGPGYLCHPCAKASGTDPFKKPAAPRKRKTPADKRKVVHIEERSFPTLVTICIDVVARHIDDVEAFGDIGTLNLEAISKAISKNRSLTSENAPLFYNAEQTKLVMYDATNLSPDAFIAMGNLNPNLTTLRLDFCGPLNDTVIAAWNNSLPNLVSLELFGPFLIREAAWLSFLESHFNMEAFLITQSPRFSLDCLNALVEYSKRTLKKLALREVGKMCDEFLEQIAEFSKLEYLDIAEPDHSCSDEGMIQLLEAVGGNLTHLDLSGHGLLTDEVLSEGLAPNLRVLKDLKMTHLPEITDAGVAALFSSLDKNTGLVSVDLGRNPTLGTPALEALLAHSGATMQHLCINGWKDVTEEGLSLIKDARELRTLDVGWCRAVDNFVVDRWVGGDDGCRNLEELKVWGCGRVEGKWGRAGKGKRRGLRVYGIESQTVL